MPRIRTGTVSDLDSGRAACAQKRAQLALGTVFAGRRPVACG